jgi:S-adenosylhomocysteine hydrolase
MTQNLKGKVAVVTGSGQGIGRSIALELASQGAAVVTNTVSPVQPAMLSWMIIYSSPSGRPTKRITG